jgi:hypothetical protein
MPATPIPEPIAKTHPLPQRSESAPPSRFPTTVHAPPTANTHPSVIASKPRSTAWATWWVVTIW